MQTAVHVYLKKLVVLACSLECLYILVWQRLWLRGKLILLVQPLNETERKPDFDFSPKAELPQTTGSLSLANQQSVPIDTRNAVLISFPLCFLHSGK